MSKSARLVGRRKFLRGAAAGAAGLAAAPVGAAQLAEPRATSETGGAVEITGNEKPGSDFMVDVLKTLGIEYCAANPGSSFRGLKESFVNYGGNKSPEWLTCCHEESAAAFAPTTTGDAVNGKRLLMRNGCYQCHGTVGQGGLAGPRLAQTRLAEAGFISYVRNPRPGNMPPYRGKVMTDQELADVYAYLRSVPPPVPLANIPILNQ